MNKTEKKVLKMMTKWIKDAKEKNKTMDTMWNAIQKSRIPVTRWVKDEELGESVLEEPGDGS